VYHIELRQFPHNFCRFNLTDRELRELAVPWARGEWVEAGDRKWTPHQATLTVLEGERIPVNQLSIGRGWRNARRRSEDVTDRVLGEAAKIGDAGSTVGAESSRREEPKGSAGGAAAGVGDAGGTGEAGAPAAAPALVLDSLGPWLLEVLGADRAQLSVAWRRAFEESPGRSPSVCLALAEEALRSAEPR
jgi:hypothetical protein